MARTLIKSINAPRSSIRLNLANGFGSTNIYARRWTNVITNTGIDISYTDDSSLGGFFTINTPGLYEISYTDETSTQEQIGIVRNPQISDASTPVSVLAVAKMLKSAAPIFIAGGAYGENVTLTIQLNPGDTIYAWTQGHVGSGGSTWQEDFSITKVSN